MSKELNCKWFFGLEAPGNEHGPNSATQLSFQGTPAHSLIRESIQNSLDAVDDTTRPVVVTIDDNAFAGLDFPEFFKLYDHIEGCLERYPHNNDAQSQYAPMRSYFASTNQRMNYWRIMDSNTTGMHYDAANPTNPLSTFHAFMSEGNAAHNGDNGAGGSFGFGKSAFWVMSPISTVFVSSRTGDQTNFIGQAKLCTHYHSEQPEKDFAPNGLYSTNGDGKVITNEECIPKEFRQQEKGTSIYVLGAPYIDDNVRKELVEAVLRNFWMAIYRNRLIVNLDRGSKRIVINSKTLPQLMEQHFVEPTNNGKKENYEYNPRYFYEIVVNAEDGNVEGYKKVEGATVKMRGDDIPVTLYIHKQQDAKQFLFMRSPLMTVYTKAPSMYKGADGVFVCEDEKGNSHLREMEDWKHDSWTKEGYKARKHNPNEAASTLRAIDQHIKEIIQEELRQDAPDTQQIAGLDKILTISTPKGADDGSKKDEIVNPENLSNKKKETQLKTKSKAKPVVRHPREAKAKFDKEGRWLSNSGGKRKKRPLKPGPSKPGSMGNKSEEATDGVTGIYAVPINVGYRTWSQVEEGQVWHIIRIFSETDINNAIIEVYGVDDEGRAIGLNIVEVDGDYEIRSGEEFVDNTDFEDTDSDSKAASKQVKNAIGNVRIEAQKPKTLKVRFNSNIKYSLRINTDKEETNESE